VVFGVFENELTGYAFCHLGGLLFLESIIKSTVPTGYASAFRVFVEQTSNRHSVTKTLEMCVESE
jgi:hypothetical protein